MVNYQDPRTIAQEFVALVKLWHVVNGIYIWEFVTTTYHEWDVIQGRRPYRWTIWIYSITRLSALIAVILNMIGFDATTPINCQVWVTSEVLFAYSALAAGALLIVLRIIAVWNMNKIIIAIAMAIWLTDVSLLIRGMTLLRSVWSPVANTCVLLNLESTNINVFGSLIVDVLLLLIMLLGLFHQGLMLGNGFGLGRILWKQGLIWLVIATLAEVPPVVFMILNLNVSLNLMFQTPAMVALSIAATRIYRSLMDFVPPDVSRNSRLKSGRMTSSRSRSGTEIALPSRTEVFVRTDQAQTPTLQTSRVSYISKDSGGIYKAHDVTLNVDVELGPEQEK